MPFLTTNYSHATGQRRATKSNKRALLSRSLRALGRGNLRVVSSLDGPSFGAPESTENSHGDLYGERGHFNSRCSTLGTKLRVNSLATRRSSGN